MLGVGLQRQKGEKCGEIRDANRNRGWKKDGDR